MGLASIYVLEGLVKRVWESSAALPMLTTMDLRLSAVRPGPCTALLVVTSTELAATPCIWMGRARKRACRRSWVPTGALDTAVLVTAENVPMDRLSGTVATACPPLGMAVVPLVAASTDTDTATPATNTDTDTGRDTGTAVVTC